jgi:hypothetical protein
MINSISPPSWLDAAVEYCTAKTRHNLTTLAGFPERTKGGQWVQIDPDLPGRRQCAVTSAESSRYQYDEGRAIEITTI